MSTKQKLILAFFVIGLFTACENNITTECETPEDLTQNLTKFSDLQTNVFNETCALSGCHAGPSPKAGLLLTSGDSYSNLVNVTSVLNPNFERVEPGNSLNSFIIKMLRNTGERTSQMPPSGKLGDDQIDSIAAWIDRGALND